MQRHSYSGIKVNLKMRFIIIIGAKKIFLMNHGGQYTFIIMEQEVVNSKTEIKKVVEKVLSDKFSKVLETITQIESRKEKSTLFQTYLVYLKKEPSSKVLDGKAFDLEDIPDGRTVFDPDLVSFITKYKSKIR